MGISFFSKLLSGLNHRRHITSTMELIYTGKDRYGYPRMRAASPEAIDQLLTIKSTLESRGFANIPIWSPPDSNDIVIVTFRERGKNYSVDSVYLITPELRTLTKSGKKIVNVLTKSSKLLRAPERGDILQLDELLG